MNMRGVGTCGCVCQSTNLCESLCCLKGGVWDVLAPPFWARRMRASCGVCYLGCLDALGLPLLQSDGEIERMNLLSVRKCFGARGRAGARAGGTSAWGRGAGGAGREAWGPCLAQKGGSETTRPPLSDNTITRTDLYFGTRTHTYQRPAYSWHTENRPQMLVV